MARKAKELKKLREETGLGQKKFGKLFGYSDAQINRWENGEQGVTDDAAIKIADAMTLRLRRPITPFQVKPEFNYVQLGPLPERARDHHLEAVARSYEIRAQKLIEDSTAPPPPPAGEVAPPVAKKQRG